MSVQCAAFRCRKRQASRSIGFYLVDRNVDEKIVGYAMKLFVDEALVFVQKVEITRIKK